VKHASPATLDLLAGLLEELRALPGLTERQRGVFYRRGRAFLHFHEDPAGLFADIRDAAGIDFERLDVSDQMGRIQLVQLARART
jgi:hypothetical protein